MAETFKIQYAFGERRIDKLTTARMYVFAPDAPEEKLNAYPGVQASRWLSHTKDAHGRRLEIEYTLTRPVLLKLVMMYSSHGEPRVRRVLYVHIDPALPQFRLTGLTGFGYLQGYGDVDLRASNISERALQEDHEFTVLGPPLTSEAGGVPTRHGRRRVLFTPPEDDN